ncbi:Endo-1,4-beta-xylanase C [Psilocybe cubensis]|uniref:Endo-1,4-beta-xylanase C n=2 Tax=Psilocybe cubensis TaxID=181762 RepID=A0ACB8GGH1_PSICU|nr:Endo-1,4-beta-xylanase C [Psilocybe cubensis]KAH9474646.1 Endo-1,4-beta-xylanase C [Psilocybe cubensis]
MASLALFLTLAGTLVGQVIAQAPQYGQCGGQGWSGATTCVSGWTCTYSNPYYSQCLPGAASSSAPHTTSTVPGGSTTAPSSTTTAAGGSSTLQAGYSFIRAVEDPNFHKYLQSEVLNTASDAVLGEPSTAAQFQITGGQLIQNANGKNLYAVVEPRANSTVVKLKVSWSTTPATSGTFVFSGDTVEWSNPSITRPQNNAWLVCPDAAGNKDLYVNLGAYSYQTPAGCADETIHAYTGATATA